MPQTKPMPGELYRHFKNKMYQIVAVATHSETREPYVVYQALYGDFRTYIRPYDMFISEVDHVKYPEVQQKYRFELVGSHAVVERELADPQAESVSVVRDEPAMEAAGAARCESAAESASVIETENSTSENDLVNPKFLDFLDADSYDRKYDIYASMVDELDDHLINQMAASIDEIIEDGPLHVRIESLRRSIKTKAKYELHRR
ncbi:MAG: DUF1653 domain-containing protein [Lachnospiraceae bacterium]|nr:DUF1653 domain-containing protein [Lachnospiraceae bacterium]MBQ2088848.1 DUF1653 domain-containing protein [Lachnospiraceae bacterium]MBQ4300169.1 DUF1653 domain-containing protein [Lachnospiraceae bacterium]